MAARAETSPERVRRMLGIEPGAPRNALTVQELEQVALIRRKVLSDQHVIQEHLRAVLLANSDHALDRVLKTMKGEVGSPKLHLDAAMWWLEHTGTLGEKRADGRPLHELPLDQLETVLSSALDNVHQLRALPGTSQVVDDTEEPSA